MNENYNNLPSMLGFLVRFHLKKDPATTVSMKSTETLREGAPREPQITHLPINSMWLDSGRRTLPSPEAGQSPELSPHPPPPKCCLFSRWAFWHCGGFGYEWVLGMKNIFPVQEAPSGTGLRADVESSYSLLGSLQPWGPDTFQGLL